MPGKESGSPQELSQASGSGQPPSDSVLTKQDWIDVLAGALEKTHQRSSVGKSSEARRRKREPSNSSDPDEEEEDSETKKVLGNLSSTIVGGSGSSSKKSRAGPVGRPRKNPPSESSKVGPGGNSGWKKKLAALQKAQAQLTARISALIDLTE